MLDTPSFVLPLGASAELDTCGSCRFFDRRDFGDGTVGAYGLCKFKFPGKIPDQWAIRSIDPKQKDREYIGNEDQIKDIDRCDLWRGDGKSYIVQRRVGQ